MAQRRAHQAFAPRLKHHDVFVLGEDNPSQRDHLLVAHGFADYGESFLADLVVWRDVIGTVKVSLIDLIARHEFVDFNRLATIDFQRFQFFVIDQ